MVYLVHMSVWLEYHLLLSTRLIDLQTTVFNYQLMPLPDDIKLYLIYNKTQWGGITFTDIHQLFYIRPNGATLHLLIYINYFHV